MYKEVIEIGGQKLTKAYIASLNKEQREALVEPMFNYFRKLGWLYPDFEPTKIEESYKSLLEYNPVLSVMEIYNNSSLATSICQYFCRKSFYNVTERRNNKVALTLYDVFMDDKKLKKVCWNRLGLGWYNEEEKNETFNITPKMVMYQGPRSMRLVPHTTLFKPGVAKLIYMKYSQEGDVVYDYSAGFGSRALGALSCNRIYIGIDPLTTGEIKEMLDFLKIDNSRYKLVNGVSEEYRDCINCVDLAFSSPPYFDQEFYSNEANQAYSKGEDYFYNYYWKRTLDNIKCMLKPNKLFILNVGIAYPKILEMAKNIFEEPLEIFRLRLVRSHLNKTGKKDAQKYEPVYVFRNKK